VGKRSPLLTKRRSQERSPERDLAPGIDQEAVVVQRAAPGVVQGASLRVVPEVNQGASPGTSLAANPGTSLAANPVASLVANPAASLTANPSLLLGHPVIKGVDLEADQEAEVEADQVRNNNGHVRGN